MADRIEVQPQKNGKWRVSGERDSFESRSEAVAAAYQAAGAEELFNEAGESRGHAPVKVPVVLLRLDGSVYGELAVPPAGAGAQTVTLTPAGEQSTARLGG